jgi:hypothetical protein
VPAVGGIPGWPEAATAWDVAPSRCRLKARKSTTTIITERTLQEPSAWWIKLSFFLFIFFKKKICGQRGIGILQAYGSNTRASRQASLSLTPNVKVGMLDICLQEIFYLHALRNR